jgi:hypothetical protein
MWKIDSGSGSGVTGVGYQPALTWPAAQLGHKTIVLKNKDASASLFYRLLAYSGRELGIEVTPETALAAGGTACFHLQQQWARLVLEVKHGSGAAAWQVEYQGQGA